MSRGIRLTLIAAVLAGLATVAAAADITLTRAGDLYRVAPTEEGLVVDISFADGTTGELLVPQTAGIVASSLQIGVDETPRSVFVLWQENAGPAATVLLAHYTQGTWFGPTVLAGGDGTVAVNPELLVFDHTAEIEIVVDVAGDEQPETEQTETLLVEETYLHLAWWGYLDSVDDGSAYYAGVPLAGDGMPDFTDFMPTQVSNLLPFGISCPGISDAPGLARPMLFVDPGTGDPHLFATDFGECLFQIYRLLFVPADPENPEDGEAAAKRRRRNIIDLRAARMLPARASANLATAKVGVGGDLSLVLYWLEEKTADYLLFHADGSSARSSVPLGDQLSAERAVELILTLTH